MPLIMNFSYDPNISERILRRTGYDELKMKMSFEVSVQKREELMDQFYIEFSNKWTKECSTIHYQLKKITRFSIEEIKMLQKQFNNFIENKYSKQDIVDGKNEDEDINEEEDSPKFVKKGISKQEFATLMIQFNSEIKGDKITIRKEQLSKIFELFIEIEGGVLDLRYDSFNSFLIDEIAYLLFLFPIT